MVESDGIARPYRSIDPVYTHLILREYEYFTLMLSDNQNFLGRMVIWLVRPGTMQRRSQLSSGEVIELQRIEQHAEAALDRLWKPDHINYAWLGNLFHLHGGHGHEHIVPRYKMWREFDGVRHVDGQWGKNFSPKSAVYPEEKTIALLCDVIKAALPS